MEDKKKRIPDAREEDSSRVPQPEGAAQSAGNHHDDTEGAHGEEKHSRDHARHHGHGHDHGGKHHDAGCDDDCCCDDDDDCCRGIDCGCGHDHGGDEDGGEKKLLLVGGAVFAAGLLCSRLLSLQWVGTVLLLAAYAVLGFEVLKEAAGNILRGEVFDECFLMSVSTLGALALGELPEAAAVMFFYRLGEFFEDLAVDRSERSVRSLLSIRPDSAWVRRDGEWQSVSPKKVAVGEQILVRSGERVPLDGVVLEGSSALDTRALTGESRPRTVGVGDTALSGCINGGGALILETKSAYEESTASRIIELVRSASERKAPSENFIRRFAKVYTPAVVIAAALLALLPPLLLRGGWTDWLRRSLVFLVISCPCALVISVPLTFLGGVGAASRRGVLFKGSNYLEALNAVETMVFDKTGTLTEGCFTVKKLLPADGVPEKELLRRAAAAETLSNHPIARSIQQAWGEERLPEIREFCELSGRGIRAEAEGECILAGSERLMEENGIAFVPCTEEGTRVYVAADGKYLGCLLIGDRIRSGCAGALDALRRSGVKRFVMLTGDGTSAARSVAEELGIDETAADLLPGQKLEYVEKLLSECGGKLAFVGDGINDAPVLSRADVGVAMGALGSDAAIEAADVVLMTDELSRLAEARRIAGLTRRIVVENIVFAIGVKLLFLLLGALGLVGMWVAVIGDVGVMLLAVLNAMRMLRK